MRARGRRSITVMLLASALGLIGVALVLGALRPWVTTSAVGGGTETMRGLELGGWWVVGFGVVLIAGAAGLWTVRSPAIGSVAVPIGVLLLLLLGWVRSLVVEVRGYLRVEGSAAGISNSITRSVHHPIVSLRGDLAMQVLNVAGVLAISVGVLAVLFSLAPLARTSLARQHA